ncbi:kinase-like protein [Serendipita vermifera]|nr:kinase-like protein [Serendipita vermifera]
MLVEVAVKVLEPIGTLRSMRRKVDRERSVWASLDHPNVLPLYGFCNDSDFDPYGAFISPWCPNGDSNTYLQDMGDSLDLNERLELMEFCGVAKGVAYIHSLSLVHGDIKPTNILIDGEGNPRICDFGLARIYLTEGNSGFTTSTPHTGTDRYLAPELLNAIDNVLPIPTTESDVYALGCVGLKFNFLRDPYADCVNNLRAQIFDAIRQGIPPALTWSRHQATYSP